jgi:hypothetical protein
VDLTKAAATELDKLKLVTGQATADLFRFAFTLLRIYVKAKQDGHELRIIDPNDLSTQTRLELPMEVSHSAGKKNAAN